MSGTVARREFLISIVIAAAGAVTLRGAGARAAEGAAPMTASTPDAGDWQSVLEAMFPQQKVDRSLYAVPAGALVAAAAKDPASARLLTGGWQTLNRLAGGDWRAAGPARQTEALAGIAGTPLFGVLRQTMVFTFYANPEVWKACGYEGEAWSHGGYVGPGLVTVDWLPEPPTPHTGTGR